MIKAQIRQIDEAPICCVDFYDDKYYFSMFYRRVLRIDMALT